MRSTGTTGTTDDEEIDDAMLVMPLGPPSPKHLAFLQAHQQGNGSHFPSASTPNSPATPNYPASPTMPMSAGMIPPSSWGNHKYNYATLGSNYATYKSRSRIRAANSYVSSPFTPVTSASTSSPYTQSNPTSTPSSVHSGNGGFPLNGKAKSVISIEKCGGGFGGVVGRGSISVGTRGTMGGTTRKSVGASVEAVGITAEGFFTVPPPPASVGVGNGNGGKELVEERRDADTPSAEDPHLQLISTDSSDSRRVDV
ncbi:hypothetical protein L218DRAFT_243873 [Marasmius fiardii PR-910]|nr:hypothetical protein L218DRAFT_243873 [Marasmius fiardii PR-910]